MQRQLRKRGGKIERKMRTQLKISTTTAAAGTASLVKRCLLSSAFSEEQPLLHMLRAAAKTMASSLGAPAKMRLCSVVPPSVSRARRFSFAAAVAHASSSPSTSSCSFPCSSSSSSSSTPPPTIALRAALAYDGSGFAGFQLQGGNGTSSGGKRKRKGSGGAGAPPPPPRTVQGELEKALLTVSSGGRRRGREGEGGAAADDDEERARRRAALRLHAAGRTDAGVHARGQVISFALPSGIISSSPSAAGGGFGFAGEEEEGSESEQPWLASLERSLNRLLPADVRLRALERCPPDFSARFSALGKHYSFTVLAGAEPDPLTRRHAHCERRRRPYWLQRPGSGSGSGSSSSFPSSSPSSSLSSLPLSLLDVGAMREAASHFVGQRDFTHFASINAAHPASDPVRLVERASVRVLGGGYGEEGGGEEDGEEDEEDFFDFDDSASNDGGGASATPAPCSLRLRFDFQGEGFLYRQVRHMSGALLAVGMGKLSPGDIREKLERGSRSPPAAAYRGWTVADAAGLCLERVFYPSYDDFRKPIHADLPHDEFGRVSVEALSSRRNSRGRQAQAFASSSDDDSATRLSASSSSSSSSSLDEELRGVKAARRRAAGMPATGSDLLERREGDDEKKNEKSP